MAARGRNILLAHPPLVLISGFFCLIVSGTLLLKLPFAVHEHLSWLQTAFTVTSAVTVTGLTVVDTGLFTRFGQCVLLLLMQAGGLGFMTFAVLALSRLQRGFGVHGQLVAQEALGVPLKQLRNTASAVVKFAIVAETTGFILLLLGFSHHFSPGEAAYHALFFSVSAFNNAGFATNGESLIPFADNAAILLPVSGLIIAGGLGFLVIMDLRNHLHWRQWSVNTKVVIVTTLGLNIVGFLVIWFLERNNSATLAAMPTAKQALNAWFQAVTVRTAGFNSITIGDLRDATTMLILMLMFIGAGSMSTGGGLKVGTFAVLLLTTWSFIRQHGQVIVFGRSIEEKQVKKALALTAIMFMLSFFAIFILAAIEEYHDLTDVSFEVISALATVGLTRGITGYLSEAGECTLMLLMFAGRVGPLSLMYLITRPKPQKLKFAETSITVG